ncbi:MAG TPA: alpha/beta fold hydrolase [Trebonia sp.]|nr:alpha/beta fold hydrolase [Trebonia sp.]
MGTDVAAAGLAVAELTRDGRFEEVAARFGPRLRAAASAGTLEVAWRAEQARLGPVTRIGTPVTEPGEPGLVLVVVPVVFEQGELSLRMAIDPDGLLHGLRIAPAADGWEPPSYAAPNRFTEREVTIGDGPLAVPGTLTLPRGRGTGPGVVLLAGGGPFDRDETSGPNKPLKDLAWGLATRGVAVLRFDKVTYAHSEVSDEPGYTMTREYVPHGAAAVRLLRQQPGVDPGRVFVLGHSLGGKAAPRVAAAEPALAGLILLAGDASPMHRSAVRVARYLADVSPGPDMEQAVATLTRQAELVDSQELSASTPAGDLPFGLPASFWLDEREYRPVPTAAAAGKPMLILQGGRDYQVTVQDDLTRWREGLGQRADVTIRVYDPDNHLFFPGTGKSTPADYAAPQHVDPDVIADIARWLGPRRRNRLALFGPRGRRRPSASAR